MRASSSTVSRSGAYATYTTATRRTRPRPRWPARCDCFRPRPPGPPSTSRPPASAASARSRPPSGACFERERTTGSRTSRRRQADARPAALTGRGGDAARPRRDGGGSAPARWNGTGDRGGALPIAAPLLFHARPDEPISSHPEDLASHGVHDQPDVGVEVHRPEEDEDKSGDEPQPPDDLRD